MNNRQTASTGRSVELCDTKIIEALLASRVPGRVSARTCSPTNRTPAPVARLRHCRCGACRTCLENARWERIFREKFADPDYYSRSLVRHESPLREW